MMKKKKPKKTSSTEGKKNNPKFKQTTRRITSYSIIIIIVVQHTHIHSRKTLPLRRGHASLGLSLANFRSRPLPLLKHDVAKGTRVLRRRLGTGKFLLNV